MVIREALVFFFIGKRGCRAGIEFCLKIINSVRNNDKFQMPFDFLSRIFFICNEEELLKEIFDTIEGYVPEENVLFLSHLETEGDVWSNVIENENIFNVQLFSPLVFKLDQIENPHAILIYSISSGFDAGIAEYLIDNFLIINSNIEITLIGTILNSDIEGPLAVYWTLLGLKVLFLDRVIGAILLDYSAIGNFLYYIRNEKEEEISFDYYDKIVGLLVFSLTVYDRKPYANMIPFVDLIKNLVLFNKIKIIIPYLITPKKKLRPDEEFYGYLEELMRDGNLFSYNPDLMNNSEDNSQENLKSLKVILANEFISYGEKHNTEYLYLIRKNLPQAVTYLSGATNFYSYPLGAENYAIILENNTNFKMFLQDLFDKFDRMIRRKSYLHILEDLHIKRENFDSILDKMIALVESYQEAEDLLYEDEEIEVTDLYEDQDKEKMEETEDEELVGDNLISDEKKTPNSEESKDVDGILGWVKKRDDNLMEELEQEEEEIRQLELKKKELEELKKKIEEEEKLKHEEEKKKEEEIIVKKKGDLLSLADQFNNL